MLKRQVLIWERKGIWIWNNNLNIILKRSYQILTLGMLMFNGSMLHTKDLVFKSAFPFGNVAYLLRCEAQKIHVNSCKQQLQLQIHQKREKKELTEKHFLIIKLFQSLYFCNLYESLYRQMQSLPIIQYATQKCSRAKNV